MILSDDRVIVNRFKITPNYSVSYVQDLDAVYSHYKRPTLNKSNGMLSHKAISRMRTALNWMLLFSKVKRVYSKVTKQSFTFKVAFITVTLSANQTHTDKEILHQMLFPFLKYLERKHQCMMYVWRAEIQGERLRNRGERCIHFHIAIDKFVHYLHIRNKWNALQRRHGYTTIEADANSTDVHAVRSRKDCVAYMSKYITKAVVSDSEKVNCKVWGMSRNFSLMDITLREESDLNYFSEVQHFTSTFSQEVKQLEYAKVYFHAIDLSSKVTLSIAAGFKKCYQLYTKGVESRTQYTIDF